MQKCVVVIFFLFIKREEHLLLKFDENNKKSQSKIHKIKSTNREIILQANDQCLHKCSTENVPHYRNQAESHAMNSAHRVF